MPLTIAERKHRMPYGAQKAVATECGVGEPFVSMVMNGDARAKTPPTQEKLRAVQTALAARLGLPVEDVFPDVQQEAAPATASASC